MAERVSGVKASVGFASETGPRERNEDFGGAVFGWELPKPRRDVVAAIADGIGGAKGGRIAAETAVRGFLDGFCDLPETMEVRRAAATVISSLNGWIYGQGKRDPALAGMGCTFTAIVLRGRIAHVLHVGDTRAYRLGGDRLALLTTDHVREGTIAPAPAAPTSCSARSASRRKCGSTTPPSRWRCTTASCCAATACTAICRPRPSPTLCASARRPKIPRVLVAAALDAGSADNCTAMVIDVVELPTAELAEVVGSAIMQLPLIPTPIMGEAVDGFLLKVLVSDGRYSRLFGAIDEIEGGEVVLKFPKPQVAAVATYHAAFVREAWVGARVNSPWIGRIIELPPGRQTCLYTVMPLYQGELLTRLARRPAVGLEEGRNIAIKLARGASALHRAGIIHRDIKPDNVILESGGSLKLIDLGVVRVPGRGFRPANIPGTLGYMAPEMLAGEPGNEATDIYALGVTMFRAFAGEFPYGNLDAVSPPRRARPIPLGELRPDLPAWLQTVLARAVATDPNERFRDMNEFAMEMEQGPVRAPLAVRRPLTLYERSPLRFWQGVSALLAVALAVSLLLRH